jgi:hypothetical protein
MTLPYDLLQKPRLEVVVAHVTHAGKCTVDTYEEEAQVSHQDMQRMTFES